MSSWRNSLNHRSGLATREHAPWGNLAANREDLARLRQKCHIERPSHEAGVDRSAARKPHGDCFGMRISNTI